MVTITVILSPQSLTGTPRSLQHAPLHHTQSVMRSRCDATYATSSPSQAAPCPPRPPQSPPCPSRATHTAPQCRAAYPPQSRAQRPTRTRTRAPCAATTRGPGYSSWNASCCPSACGTKKSCSRRHRSAGRNSEQQPCECPSYCTRGLTLPARTESAAAHPAGSPSYSSFGASSSSTAPAAAAVDHAPIAITLTEREECVEVSRTERLSLPEEAIVAPSSFQHKRQPMSLVTKNIPAEHCANTHVTVYVCCGRS
ncbi:hypothetical protein TcCL_NonESM06964 [Trypanosoma cruzi]|nr:hypothetical protein TcCL_NonESM06964 [Trypanosoma cruzi]